MKSFKKFYEETSPGVLDAPGLGKAFEIRDTTKMSKDEAQKEIELHYPYNLNYRGNEFFEKIYVDQIQPAAADALSESDEPIEGQETYLGYLPDKDLFVSGFDTWKKEYTDIPYNTALIKINAYGEVENVERCTKGYHARGIIYPDRYRELHEMYPTLIDIRLD